MTTAKVEVWRDTGYTEGSYEVPSKTSSLPTPTYTFNDVNISRDRLFSEVQLRAPYEDLYDCSYLRVTYDMNNGDDVIVYGWIDTVACSSDTPQSPMSIIVWHIDNWRTYLSKVTFGSGLVTRRPTSDDIPPQPYSARYRTSNRVADIIENPDVWWVVFTFTYKISVINYTVTAVGTFPVNIKDTSKSYTLKGPTALDGSGNAFVSSPPLDSVVGGLIEEYFSMDPTTVISMFISPVEPFQTELAEPISSEGWLAYNQGKTNSETGYPIGFLMRVFYKPFIQYSSGISPAVCTTDTITYVVTGFDGEVVATLPWGVKFNKWSYRLIVDATSAYIEVRFDRVDRITPSNIPVQQSEDMIAQIPLIPVSLTENSWSSYVYSGARNADMMQRTNALLMSGLESATSMSAGVWKTALSTTLDTQATDARVKGRSNSLALSGTGWDFITYGRAPMLVSLSMDDYSKDVRNKDIALYGAHVSESMTSCQALIDKGGPLQIHNLNVTGSVPTEAKTYIKNRLANGVIIS